MKGHKLYRIFGIAVVCLALGPLSAAADVAFIMEIKPGAALFSSDVDGFNVTRYSSVYRHESDEIDGSASLIPNIKMGAGIDIPGIYIDLMAGVGLLWNDAFYSSMWILDSALRFKVGRHFTIGPHVGLIKFNPEWDGAAEVELENELGWLIGTGITLGGKVASFSVSVDYLSASFDVKTSGGWRANDSSLDISGIAVQLGVLFRF